MEDLLVDRDQCIVLDLGMTLNRNVDRRLGKVR